MASEQLKFHVKPSDIANAANVTSLMWEPVKPPPAERLARMGGKRSRRAALTRKIATLENAVRAMYAKFGEPLPDGFDDGMSEFVVSDATRAPVDDADRVAAGALAGGHTPPPPKIGDKGRPPLPAPLVYAAEVSRPRVGDVNGIKLASSLDGGNRVRH